MLDSGEGAGSGVFQVDLPPHPFAFAINVCLAFSVSGSDMMTGPKVVPAHLGEIQVLSRDACRKWEQLVGIIESMAHCGQGITSIEHSGPPSLLPFS